MGIRNCQSKMPLTITMIDCIDCLHCSCIRLQYTTHVDNVFTLTIDQAFSTAAIFYVCKVQLRLDLKTWSVAQVFLRKGLAFCCNIAILLMYCSHKVCWLVCVEISQPIVGRI